MKETNVKKIAAILRNLREGAEKRSVVLFLGAGASRSAGIPTANELANTLENDLRYKDLLEDCLDKTYAGYMRELNPGDRKEFLQQYVNSAKLNQTHLYAAALMKEKYIDTVVTVNFDPLMLRALAMVNIFPSVYDMAISREFILGGIDHPAVVFLHGQSHGFWQLNTDDEMRMALDNISKLFVQITGTRSWIVIGYSGIDPVFDELAKIQKFEQGIYWVGYKDEVPEKKVQEQLLDKPTKSPWYLKGYNSDEFFRALKNELKVQEPNIINRPFSHLQESVKEIGDFDIEERKEKWTIQIQRWIGAAIEGFEEGKGFEKIEVAKKKNIDLAKLVMQVNEISDKKNYDDLKDLEEDILQSQNSEALTSLAYAYNGWGIKFYNEGRTTMQQPLFEEAIEKYKRSAGIRPIYEAYYNWALALYNIALLKNKDESIMKEVFEKYKMATGIDDSKDDAFYNWGLALYNLALAKKNDEALLNEAFEKYRRASVIKPSQDTFYNWGLALHLLASKKNYDESLMRESFEKYRLATEVNPGKDNAFYNWGLALYDLAVAKNYDESLMKEAIEKYQRSTEIREDDDAFYNWGLALHELGRSKNYDEAFLNEAIEKYKKATEINPNYVNAFYNWGIALQDITIEKNRDVNLLTEAFEKFEMAVRIQEDKYNAMDRMVFTVSLLKELSANEKVKELITGLIPILEKAENNNNGIQSYNLARVYSIIGNNDAALKWLEGALKYTSVSTDQINSENDFQNIKDIPKFQQLLAQYRP